MIMCKCSIHAILNVAILSFQLYTSYEKQIKEEIVMTKHICVSTVYLERPNRNVW